MSKNKLFAIDSKTNDVTVSESGSSSNSIEFLERISRSENEILHNAVVTLTSISKATEFDAALFKSMDKVCQLIYVKFKDEVL